MLKTKSLIGLSILTVCASLSGNAFAYYGSNTGTWSGSDSTCTSDCGGQYYTGSGYDYHYGSSYDYNYQSSDMAKMSAWSGYNGGTLQKDDVYKDSNNYYGTKQNNNTTYQNKIDDYHNTGKIESVLFDYGDQCVVLEDITFNKKIFYLKFLL